MIFNIDTYLIIINIVGFIWALINLLLKKFIHYIKNDILLILVSFMGGSLGILLVTWLFDKRYEKDNMMSRILIICMFVIQLILFILFKTNNLNEISFDIIGLFSENKVLLYYLIFINIITFIAFALDKLKAVLGKWRLKIITLLGLCFIGGSVGGLLSMYIFRHKTKVNYFVWGIPIIMMMQVVVIMFLINV